MFLRGDTWHYDFISGGIRYRGSTGFKKNEKTKAEREVQRLKVEAREKHSIEMIWEQTKRRSSFGKDIPMSFDALWGAFTKTAYSNAGEERMKIYSFRVKSFCEWIHENHRDVKKLSEITPAIAEEWVSCVRSMGGSNYTKNDNMVIMRMLFRALGSEYGIVENPFSKIKKLPCESSSREAFTPEELALIGKNAKGWVYSLCLTAVSTGLREGDICMMKKKDVNLDDGWISLRTRKTKTSVEIPILPGLRKHLEERLSEDEESEFVFPELAKMYTISSCSIGHEIKKFFQEIGIQDATKTVDGYKRRISSKDVHSFRHTFVYLAAVNGVPFPIVQGIVGHASPEMTKHYMDHANRQKKAEYIAKLPDYINGDIKKIPARKAVTSERVAHLVERLTPDNLERNKKVLISWLQRHPF